MNFHIAVLPFFSWWLLTTEVYLAKPPVFQRCDARGHMDMTENNHMVINLTKAKMRNLMRKRSVPLWLHSHNQFHPNLRWSAKQRKEKLILNLAFYPLSSAVSGVNWILHVFIFPAPWNSCHTHKMGKKCSNGQSPVSVWYVHLLLTLSLPALRC